MKTTRCLGIVESSYKSKKERGSGHSCFVSGFVKAGVCVVCPTFSSLPQEGGTPPVFKEEDTPIFESNEHLHWLTPFLEFMDLNRKKKRVLNLWEEKDFFLNVILAELEERHRTLWLNLSCVSWVTHITKASNFKIRTSRPVSADSGWGCVQ